MSSPGASAASAVEPEFHAAAAVLIGRFQPWHQGHLALLRQALHGARRVVVVIGSAWQARTPRNPFTWHERAEMARLSLAEADRDRVHFAPVRDYYDEPRWVAAVQRGVARALAGSAPPGEAATPAAVALVGHFKDATSSYLRAFPNWKLVDLPRQSPVDATALRDSYFGAAASGCEACLAAWVDLAPPSTVNFLRAWLALPFYPALAAEWHQLREERAAWRGAPYPPVFVTVDAVVRCAGCVLLVRRGRAPGKGLLALPGGFVEQRETLYRAAVRELHEETGLHLLDSSMHDCLRAVRVFDHPDRSQRGRTITHAHFFDLGARRLPEVAGADDAAAAVWMPLDQLAAHEAELFDDHFRILDTFFAVIVPDVEAEAGA